MSVFDVGAGDRGRDQPPDREPIEVVAEEREGDHAEVVFYHPDTSKMLGEWIAVDEDTVIEIR